MQLILDPTGGIAGDMFAAVLISAGADEDQMLYALTAAADKIGKSSITTQTTKDGSTRLLMDIHHNHGHLAASKARLLIDELCEELSIGGEYVDFAKKVLEVLIAAEKQAHAENTFLTDHHHGHHHHDHGHEHNHDHGHHHHEHEEEAWLHEAQDIIIDIVGAAKGLQLLGAPVVASLLKPVSLGGGRIKFSHGEMAVPAPATKIIMDKYGISNAMGPLEVELCTPTGSAILAALGSEINDSSSVDDAKFVGNSRGGKDLEIPPLKLYLIA
ncbi:nickel insertion protein [Labilibacter marinus]|uniref:nickel insertion protein n=1 Tax=Labilibacter marinus TaxID=1477105 RepID=UPI00094F4A0C|nr:nickel insertion protein [Labilibacter marinus]